MESKIKTNFSIMKHKKPLQLKLEIYGYQEDLIVAAAIKASYERNDHCGKHEHPDDYARMREAFRLVYHYYTGRKLK
jgi:hypothetical protein